MSVKAKWVKKRAKPITGFKKFLDNNNLFMYPISYHNFFKALTKSIRIKPTYLIIGASRSGTTAMYDYLSKNRYGYRSPHKELHFFDKYFHKGILWYRGNFPTIFHKFYLEKILHKKIVTGEATARYLLLPLVAKRISKCLPDIKLIVMVRNPIERAFSHYRREFEKDNESRTFNAVVETEIKYLSSLPQNFNNNDLEEYAERFLKAPYLGRSLYNQQLQMWLKYFNKKQILLVKSEDFYQDPWSSLDKIYSFLATKNYSNSPKLKIKQNASGYKVTLDPNIKKKLNDFFSPHNQMLKKEWGITFS